MTFFLVIPLEYHRATIIEKPNGRREKVKAKVVDTGIMLLIVDIQKNNSCVSLKKDPLSIVQQLHIIRGKYITTYDTTVLQ